MVPIFSICIPAYKNTSYLKILFNSIKSQTYNNFEVIVTDDSPNNSVELLCKEFEVYFTIRYYKNNPIKGSPSNWNEAIKNAKGKWIKLMHDDDWFATNDSLKHYADIINSSENIDFIFSAYNDYENNVYKKTNRLNNSIIKRIINNPLYLFKSNYIGNPSVVLIKNNSKFYYDDKLKWVVDFEFYMRCIKEMNLFYSSEVLINVGYNKDQITKEVFRNIKVEIPENIYMLNKFGNSILKNFIVYDYYWRLFRNLNIRNFDLLQKNLDGNVLHKSLISMLKIQFVIPLRLLKIGVVSKTFMSLAYIRHRVIFN
jgi:glycosyltransferase involved in cell wall biosynthesis